MRRKAKMDGPTHLDLPSQGHSLCQSALVVRLGDFCLDPPSRGHPSGSSVLGTSVWILRLGDIRLDPPSRGHPSGSSVSGISVWNLRLRDIRLEPPSQGHPSGISVSGTSVSAFKSHQRKLFYSSLTRQFKQIQEVINSKRTCAKRMKATPRPDQSTSSLVFLLLFCFRERQ